MGWNAELAEGFGGDGADRDAESLGWEMQAAGLEEGREVARGRRAGEGDGVEGGGVVRERSLQQVDGSGGQNGAVGGGDGERHASGEKSLGEKISRLFSTNEKDLGCSLLKQCGAEVRQKGVGEGLGPCGGRDQDRTVQGMDVLVGEGCGGGGSDDGNLPRSGDDAEGARSLREDRNRIGASEDEPGEARQSCEGGVEILKGGGRQEIEGGDEQGDRAVALQLGGQGGRLRSGARDEDTTASKSLGHALPECNGSRGYFWLRGRDLPSNREGCRICGSRGGEMQGTIRGRVVLVAMLGSVAWGQSNGVEGKWRTPAGSIVNVYACGDAVCLKLVQIERDSPGTEDRNNPDPKLQSRPLCGLEMGSGFKKDADGKKAEGGTLYDPKSGKTYSGSLAAEGDTLHLRGYIGVKLFGRTEEWSRVSGPVASCH